MATGLPESDKGLAGEDCRQRVSNIRNFAKAEMELGRATQDKLQDRKFDGQFDERYRIRQKGGGTMHIQIHSDKNEGEPDKIKVVDNGKEKRVDVMARIWIVDKDKRTAECIEYCNNGEIYIIEFDNYEQGDPNKKGQEEGIDYWSSTSGKKRASALENPRTQFYLAFFSSLNPV